MQEIGAYEAKTHLAHLLDRVERGERFLLARHGKPVAMLIPCAPKPANSQVIQELKAFGQGRRLAGISLKELIAEDRRS